MTTEPGARAWRRHPGRWSLFVVALSVTAPTLAQSPPSAAPRSAASLSAGAQSVPSTLPGMSARETEYLALWSLRAGLNVAALQCQYSKALRTVDNYNSFLRQHSDELAAAYKGLDAYFARIDGARLGPRKFDTLNTRIYQNFSAVETQHAFCEKAAMVGREALFVPKGKAGGFAMTALAPFRDTLDVQKVAKNNPLLVGVSLQPVPEIACSGRRC